MRPGAKLDNYCENMFKITFACIVYGSRRGFCNIMQVCTAYFHIIAYLPYKVSYSNVTMFAISLFTDASIFSLGLGVLSCLPFFRV